MNKFINKYGLYILTIITFVIVLIIIAFFFKQIRNGFVSEFGNVAKEFKFNNVNGERISDVLKTPDTEINKYLLKLDNYVNITGFKVELFSEYVDKIIEYQLKVETDLVNEYVKSGNDNVFKAGRYYDIKNSNYNINELFILMEATSDITDLDKIGTIKIYGITQFNKLVDDDINIIKNYDTQSINIQFNKIRDIQNIEYYFVLIAKYNINKDFISKQIIRLNNNKINFIAKLETLIPSKYIDYSENVDSTIIPKTTTLNDDLTLKDFISEKFEPIKINKSSSLSDVASILSEYKKEELLDVFKLILQNQYLDNNKEVSLLLKNINDYSTMKFLDSEEEGDDKDTFIRKWDQNYYYYQSEEIKKLLQYVYDLIENYEDACTDYSCLISTPKLEVLDSYSNPFYYKVGVGYVRLDILGNEIFSPITSYRNSDGEVLFTMQKDSKTLLENDITTGDNLYNKLKIINNTDVKRIRGIIGSNYPNNFQISEQNLKDYVDLDEYTYNKYSPIQFNINITDNPISTTQNPTTTNYFTTTTTQNPTTTNYFTTTTTQNPTTTNYFTTTTTQNPTTTTQQATSTTQQATSTTQQATSTTQQAPYNIHEIIVTTDEINTYDRKTLFESKKQETINFESDVFDLTINPGTTYTNIPESYFSKLNIIKLTLINGITKIENSAFELINEKYTYSANPIILKNIIIPRSVVSIGDYAFYDIIINNDNGLFELDNSKLKSIGAYAFCNEDNGISYINNLVIPNEVTEILNNAFESVNINNDIGLFSRDSNIENIGDNAFNYYYNNTYPENMFVPSSIPQTSYNRIGFKELL
jgi:hypothetical protein